MSVEQIVDDPEDLHARRDVVARVKIDPPIAAKRRVESLAALSAAKSPRDFHHLG